MAIAYSKNDIHLTNITQNLFSVLIGSFGIVIVGVVTNIFIEIFYIRLIVTVATSVVIYIVVLVVLRNSIALEIIQNIRSRLRNNA